MSYRNNYLDLDPTYKDPLGRPLMRMTFDYQDNERKMANWMADRCDEIAKAMGARQTPGQSPGRSMVGGAYQTTHNTGGAVMGSDPKTSVVNRYLQSWDVSNVFVMGASRVPAKRRLQSDRHGRRADLLVARCDQQISEIARPAGADMRVCAASILFARAVHVKRQRAWPIPTITSSPSAAARSTTAGDCVACHTAPGGTPFAGGLALATPFGVIMTPNITPDDATGIGRWSKDEFSPRDARRAGAATAPISIRRFPIPITPR